MDAKVSVENVYEDVRDLSSNVSGRHTSAFRLCMRGLSVAVKSILFVFNALLLLAGLLMAGLGAWQLIEKYEMTEDRMNRVSGVINLLASICIVIGSVIIILTTAGCVGALRENVCLLRFFYWSLTGLVLVEVAGAVVAVVVVSRFRQLVESVLDKKLVLNYHDDNDAKALLDFFQRRAQCCGVTDRSYMDWNDNKYYNCSGRADSDILQCTVPFSCCKRPDSFQKGLTNIFCGAGILKLQREFADAYVHTVGCVERMFDLAMQHLPIVAATVFSVIVPQLFMVIMARILEGQIREQSSYVV